MKTAKSVYLGKFETGFYFAAWTIGVFYSIYRVHLITYYFETYSSYEGFSPGWSWIGSKRDTTDVEWATWIPFMFKLLPWTLIQLFVSQILKYTRNTTILCCWYLSISMLFLWRYVGFLGLLCMLVQPCVACLLVSIRSKRISCLVHLISLGVIQLTKTLHVVSQDWLALEDDEKYLMFVIAVCWMQLRSISCTVDRIDNYRHKSLTGFLIDLLHSAAYCLYLPTLFLGPLILYSEFIDGINRVPTGWNFKRLTIFLLQLLRYVFWLYFTEFSMHFVHFNALQYDAEVVARLEPWAFYGFGYCMGQYFLNKYMVVYGTWGEFSRADDIAAPSQPKCIGRIHLYSDMWKHFDRGLYNFLIRYIYLPVSMRTNIPLARLFASLLSFSFVFLWHGMQMFIFIWAFLNFLGLTVESAARSIGRSRIYSRFQADYLSPRNRRRFECAVAAPLLAFSAISNFYFFAGTEIGHSFMYRIFTDSFTTVASLLFFLYCCCQVSTEVKIYERRRADAIVQ